MLEKNEDGTTNWTSLKESKAPIFDYDLWEPGYTDVKILKVENEGSLALKWMAKFVSDAELSILADVIDVYVKPSAEELAYPADRDLTGYTKVGTVADFVNTIEETTTGTLTPSGTDGSVAYLGIALKMQESAGNTYQGKELGAFDIMIVATQLDYESDSFGKDYDEGLTPPDEDGDILVEENGIQYLYRADGSHWLYYVTPEYAEETVIVPEGVTTIGGSSFAYNSNVKEVVFSSTVRTVRTNAFKGNTSVEKIVLNEGLTDLSTYERAFSQASGLKEIVFPSTLKSIGKQAFRSIAAEELTIPENVEVIGEGAFRDSSNLKTVTIEGNAEIGNYAFRKCASLETVYLLGDDVTFAGNSQVFTHADTGAAQGITVFVKNETVAERLRAAQPSLQGLNIRIIGEPLTVKVESEDALLTALSNITEPTVIDATGVTVNIDDIPDGKSATFLYIASGVTLKGATINPTYRGGNYVMFTAGAGNEVVFEDCVFTNTKNLVLGSAADGPDSVVYNNCDFEGYVITNFVDNLDGVAEFNNCEFKTNTSNRQNFVEGMGGTHNFNGCTFDFTGVTQSSMGVITNGCVNVYSEPEYSTTVVLNGCTRTNCGTRTYGPNSSLVVK